MIVWGDADSLPREVRDTVRRRVGAELARDPGLPLRAVFVANRPLPEAASAGVSFVRVGSGEGEADAYIEEGCRAGDLVLTRDIPLAERLLASRDGMVTVMNDRGDRFSPDSVGERRSIRDAMRELSLSGLVERPGRSYGPREARAFCLAFDREFSRLLRMAKGVSDAARLLP